MNGVKTIPRATRTHPQKGKGRAVIIILETDKQVLNIKHGKKKTEVQILRVEKRGKK